MKPRAEVLHRLYWTEKKSAREIASLLNVSDSTVLDWLKREGIPRRRQGRTQKVEIDHERLHDLYWNQGKSTVEISKILGVHRVTVFGYLKKYGIKLRERLGAVSEAGPKKRVHVRRPFSNDPLEREYLLGLSEDLSVARVSTWSIEVGLSTTHPSMLELFAECFEKYGHVWKYPVYDKSSYQWRIRTLLDSTFEFLLKPNRNYDLQRLSDDEFLYRLAGLIDAEGTIQLTRSGKYAVRSIKIGMGNFSFLSQVSQDWLEWDSVRNYTREEMMYVI